MRDCMYIRERWTEVDEVDGTRWGMKLRDVERDLVGDIRRQRPNRSRSQATGKLMSKICIMAPKLLTFS